MIAVVLQPSYVPWRGYFDLIRRADVFVFYDDVQFDKHGWRNRNRIKTPSGPQWITIPVKARGNVESKTAINTIEIDGRSNWPRKHLESIRHSYRRAPHFESIYPFVGSLLESPPGLLCDFTIATTTAVAERLGLHPQWVRSSSYDLHGTKLERLLDLLIKVGATHYISGPSAKSYIDPRRFEEAGITLEYIDYSYEPYPQLYGDFEGAVSILDLLMMTGPEAPRFLEPAARALTL